MTRELRQQALLLLCEEAEHSEVHRWLCHPGQQCVDGCRTVAIPTRLDALEDAGTILHRMREAYKDAVLSVESFRSVT